VDRFGQNNGALGGGQLGDWAYRDTYDEPDESGSSALDDED